MATATTPSALPAPASPPQKQAADAVCAIPGPATPEGAPPPPRSDGSAAGSATDVAALAAAAATSSWSALLDEDEDEVGVTPLAPLHPPSAPPCLVEASATREEATVALVWGATPTPGGQEGAQYVLEVCQVRSWMGGEGKGGPAAGAAGGVLKATQCRLFPPRPTDLTTTTQLSPTGTHPASTWSTCYAGPATHVQVRALAPGARYAFRVATVAPACAARAPSVAATLATPPPPPPPPAAPHPPALAARGSDELGFRWAAAARGGATYVLSLAAAEAALAAAADENEGATTTAVTWVEAYRGPDAEAVVGGLTGGSLYAARVKVRVEREGRTGVLCVCVCVCVFGRPPPW